jgi:hypothetical protein
MSLRWSLLILCVLVASALQAAENEVSEDEKRDGYVLLFNGKDLKGWHRVGEGYGGWHVKDGALCVSKGGGMLFTNAQYDHFILKVECKMSKGANSGVFLRVGNPRDEVQTGIEVQILDDHGRKPGLHSCGALYDLVPPRKIVTRPVGEWNAFVITVNRSRIQVELNGEQVSAINLDAWEKPGTRPDGSKHKFRMALKDFPRRGLIGLQDHGTPVCFRNIKLKPLK